ncbi:DNA-binding transcriptional regulator AgaR [uncultured Avibacterium sp.]|uniref:DNA-binding transcriptional regulator AgaR n=1 Tax=uncultured Avibacterium sp. TaxID=1936169 RepID=A0A486XDB7_9PAST|nr:DNA-binding transcriptional regulator AgaR [uncultured Avibacterium sp.]
MKSAIERRMEIVAIVNKNSSARVEDLAETFSVSTVTIRQDLNFLEKMAILCVPTAVLYRIKE